MPAQGYGFFLPPELLLVHAANKIETPGDFPFHPLEIRGIGFNGELAGQRSRLLRQLFAARVLAYPKIDQTTFQIGSLHPFRHLLIVIVRYQQREAEVAEHSFNGAFPYRILLTNLEQLACKRHLIFSNIQRLTERAPHGNLFFVDIAHAGFQPLDLRGQLLMLMTPLGKEYTRLIEIVLNTGFSFSRCLMYG